MKIKLLKKQVVLEIASTSLLTPPLKPQLTIDDKIVSCNSLFYSRWSFDATPFQEENTLVLLP